MGEQSLITLFEECKKGDKKAIRQLYIQIYPQMMNLCMRYVFNKTDAEDLFAETFLKILTRIDTIKYESEEHLMNTIKRIFINSAIDFLRYRKRVSLISIQEITGSRTTHTDEETIYDLMEGEEEGDILIETSEESSILDEISPEDIIEAIQQLPDAYRTVFNMHVIDGLSHDYIAATLGITPSTSRANLSRARKQLIKILITKFPHLKKYIIISANKSNEGQL